MESSVVIAQIGEPASTDRTAHGVVLDASTSADTIATGVGCGVGLPVVTSGVGTTGVAAALGARAVEAVGAGLTAQDAAIRAAIPTATANDTG
jgi:hypothetical protein